MDVEGFYALTPVPHDPFAELPPDVASYIKSHKAANEWDAPGVSRELPDAANAANPPGERQSLPDLSVLESLRSRRSFDERAAPDFHEDFARKLYEKGKYGEWKSMKDDAESGEFNMTPDQLEHAFPIMPWTDVTRAEYTLTPVDHDPFSQASQ